MNEITINDICMVCRKHLQDNDCRGYVSGTGDLCGTPIRLVHAICPPCGARFQEKINSPLPASIEAITIDSEAKT